MISRRLYPGRRGRRPLLALAIAAVGAASILVVGVVLAVHELEFQLDGDVSASTTTSIGGSTQDYDWDSLITAAGAPKTSLPAGFDHVGFTKDFVASGTTFVTSDTTTFATGSKDTLPISGWQCAYANNVNSKIDVMNVYAAAYVDPATKDEVIYFALERNTNTGDANVGFWFLQDSVSCSTTGSAVTFTGAHRDGDLLIVSAFTNGGTVSTIDVYRWNGDAPGSLGATPVAHGVDCRGALVAPGDSACAAANTAGITTPWLTSNAKDGVGHALRTAEFFEGGVNLTKTGLGDRCFNTFIGDTRSSQSLTATLFDYAGGTIGECTSKTETTPSITTAQIPADPDDASVSVTDSATVTVDGLKTWSGDVSWHLCGPFALESTTLCTTGGVAVGTSKTVSETAPTVVSDAAIVTAVGRYCWRADFSGDTAEGLPGSSDSRSSECFTVTPRGPTLLTQATTGPIDFGLPISDTVTLGNTAHKPGTGGPTGSDGSINPTTLGGDATGDITLTAYGPDSCTTIAYGPVTIAASGDDSYGGAGSTFEFTPGSPGEYVFVASYAGDSPNTLGVTATACLEQPAAEKVTVRQIPTMISTVPSLFPQDSATVTSSLLGNNLPANGTVAFSLYQAAGGKTALQNCQAASTTGRIYTESVLTGAAAHSATVGTNNTTVRVSVDGTYYWLVTYTPGDTAHTGRQSSCVENVVADFTEDTGPGTLFP